MRSRPAQELLGQADPAGESLDLAVDVEADQVVPRLGRPVEPQAVRPGVGLVRDGSDGALVASDALKSDLSAFGRHNRQAAAPQAEPASGKAGARRISPEQAQAIALKQVPGTFRNIVIERRGKVLVYTVEIIASEGGVETDVFVDVATGKVVATER